MRTWILERFRLYGQRALLVALLASPVVFYRGAFDVFNLVKLSVMWVLGLLALGFWVVWSVERGVWLPRSKLALAAAAFFAAYGLATIFSENPMFSLIGVYHRYGGFVPHLLYGVFMLVIVGFFWERPSGAGAIPKVVAAASVPVALYVFIQAAGQDWVPWKGPDGSTPSLPLSTLGNSNFAGGYLGIAAPFIAYLAISAGRRLMKVLLAGVLAVDLAALWLTSSRGGLIGAAAGLVTMAFFYRHRLALWARVAIAGTVAVALTLAVVVVWHPGSDRPPAPLSAIRVLSTETFQIRQYYWAAALGMFVDNPLVGTGPDTYYSNYGRYRLAEDGAKLGTNLTDKPHNIYLEYAANSGILGLGAYLALLGMALWYAWRRAKVTEGSNRDLLVCFVGGLAAYSAQGFFSIDVPPLAVMGWVALGGIAVLADPGILEARSAREKAVAAKLNSRGQGKKVGSAPDNVEVVAANSGRGARPSRRMLQGVAAVATAGLIALGLRPVLADAQVKSTRLILKAEPPIPGALDKAVRKVNLAIRLYPMEGAYRNLAAQYALRQADVATDSTARNRSFAKANAGYLEAHRLEPHNVFVTMNIARLQTKWAETGEPARYEEADRWWRKSVQLDPTDWAVKANYADFLRRWGFLTRQEPIRRRAAEQYEAVIRIRADKPDVWRALGGTYLSLGERQKAHQALSTALTLAPGEPAALKLLAQLGAP